MKIGAPDILWHGRLPVFSATFAGNNVLVTGGAEPDGSGGVKIWNYCLKSGTAEFTLEFSRDLLGHQAPVNCVRFSPNGDMLASASVDGNIAIWKQQGPDHEWKQYAYLRGHVSDVCDMSWSAGGTELVSGSVDNTAIVWNLYQHERVTHHIKDHKHFVLGVAWDPLNRYVATLSSDKSLIIHTIGSWGKKNIVVSSSKAANKEPVAQISLVTDENDPSMQPKAPQRDLKLFLDDSSAKSHFRRIDWSPDGNILVAPTGVYLKGNVPAFTTYVFSRHCLSKPLLHLPCGEKYSVAVKFCPIAFQLKDEETIITQDGPSPFELPYRFVFAIATTDSVFLYDTQCFARPISFISGIHYAPITDLSWAADGLTLIVTSEDGYCTIVTFSERELGIPCPLEQLPPVMQKRETVAVMTTSTQPPSVSIAAAAQPAQSSAAAASSSSSSNINNTTDSTQSQQKKRIVPTLVSTVNPSSPALKPVVMTPSPTHNPTTAAITTDTLRASAASSDDPMDVDLPNEKGDSAEAQPVKKQPRRIVPELVQTLQQ